MLKKSESSFCYNRGMVFQFAWEVLIINWLQENIVTTPFMTSLCAVLTYLGEPLMGILIIGALYWGFDKKFGKYVGLNMLASSVINPLIKNIFFRMRPYIVNDNVKCLKAVDSSGDIYDVSVQGYSFPSGHTMATTSLFGSISLYLKERKYYIITAILVLLVGFSRISLGVHYPTDVLVSAVVGVLVLAIYTTLRKSFSEEKIMIVSAILFGVGFLYCDSNDYFQIYGIFVGFVLGCLFEKKYVHFENTKNILRVMLRTVFGGILFLGVSKFLKLPFSNDFLTNKSLLSYLVMMMRYMLAAFVAIGVYPKLFQYNLFKFKK